MMKPSCNPDRALVWACFAALCILQTGCGPGPDPDRPTGAGLDRLGSSADLRGRFTIVLAQYSGPDRIERARLLQARAVRILDRDDIWLYDEQDVLSVNYGHFKTNSPNGKAQRQYAQVRKLYPQLNSGQFQCFIAPIPQPDPAAPLDWALLNSNCAYTLEIAAYYDVPEKDYFDRKADAVLAVKQLRESGQTAYFAHGRFESRVYVGCVPAVDESSWQSPPDQAAQSLADLKALQEEHQFRYENGAKVFDVGYDKQRNKVKIPRRPLILAVDRIRDDLGF